MCCLMDNYRVRELAFLPVELLVGPLVLWVTRY